MIHEPPDAIEAIDRFCVYGVASDYETMIDLLRMRIEELRTTHESIDAVSGLQSGYASKIVAPQPIKSMGKVSMGPMLQTLGLALIVVRDDEQFARIKERLTQRQRPRQQANASSTRPTWLFKRKKARQMGKKRWSMLSEIQRKKLARKMGKASGIARRRAAREKSVALATARTAESGSTGIVRNASSSAVTAVQTFDGTK